jgi:outer membrane protein assembly factor BamB
MKLPKLLPLSAALYLIQSWALFSDTTDSGSSISAWGEKWSRNMVSGQTQLPDVLDLADGSNLVWKARLGDQTHSTPIVHEGKIYIGTNNANPRDERRIGDRGVLMCLNESDGSLLWQLAVPKRTEDRYFDWPKSGISSPATVEDQRVYIVDNRGVVLCLDTQGLSNGNDGPFQDEAAYFTPKEGGDQLELGPLDADIIWMFNMTTEAGIWSHDASHSSILIHDNLLYLNTGTGVDNTHAKIQTPDAPSLIVLDKRNGAYIAREKEGIAPNIFHCTWSSPALGMIEGKQTLIFAAGDGVLYGFDLVKECEIEEGKSQSFPIQLKKIWSFQFDPDSPKSQVHDYHKNTRQGPSNFFGMPVIYDGTVLAAGGGDLWWGKSKAWLKRVNLPTSNSGGSSGESFSALRWSHDLERHVMSTPAVQHNLVFIADMGKRIHCVNLDSGETHWTHDAKGDFWASPFLVDGKMYIGDRNGNYYIFKASAEKQLLWEGRFPSRISATANASANGLLVATMDNLWLFRQ